MPIDLTFTDATVARIGRRPEALIPILQALQDHYGYLPEAALRRVCETTEITPAALTGVASFYDMFRHAPVGRHLLRVCVGTACHVAGANHIEDELRRRLHIPTGGDTDPDGHFTIERVACLGTCTLAPVVKFDQTTLGQVTVDSIEGRVREQVELAKRKSAATTEELEPHRIARADGNPRRTGPCCMAGSDQLFHALRELPSQRQPSDREARRLRACVIARPWWR